MDVTESLVQDPAAWDNVKVQPQTAWRVDRMKNMTYTQFWQLVKERRVDKVSARILMWNLVLTCSAIVSTVLQVMSMAKVTAAMQDAINALFAVSCFR